MAEKIKVPKTLKDVVLTKDRNERIRQMNDLVNFKPPLLEDFAPKYWFYPCVVHVLIVTDGGLDFGLGGFGLSEFINTFEKLEQVSLTNIEYRVTLAHRQDPTNGFGIDPMLNSNSTIHNRIIDFRFDQSVTLSSFDQVWLFGINPSQDSLSVNEVNEIETYMNNGGGLFATGDHGSLGNAMCGSIPRVQDMRYWANTTNDNNTNEVSMNGRRRNDTNRPASGMAVSNDFHNQSDNIPQTISARSFSGGLPHPLLSISPVLRPSGVIDIMPDHPHEGECKPEATFTVTNPKTGNNHDISSQIIATSFVLAGSTAPGKAPTDPHCFPSIAVFDGRPANVGRIAIDSTWHHFVNVNLTGVGSPGVGLDQADFDVIQRYYMNTAKWISRRKIMLCMYKFVIIDILKVSQVIEASLDEPDIPFDKMSIKDLLSIGALAREVLSTEINPSFAQEFISTVLEDISPELAKSQNPWANEVRKDREKPTSDWIDNDQLINIALGSGFVALRDNDELIREFTPKNFDKLFDIFVDGIRRGLERAIEELRQEFDALNKLF